MRNEISKIRLNSNHLKLIAIIAMTIDHFADLLYPNYPAAPIPVVRVGRKSPPTVA